MQHAQSTALQFVHRQLVPGKDNGESSSGLETAVSLVSGDVNLWMASVQTGRLFDYVIIGVSGEWRHRAAACCLRLPALRLGTPAGAWFLFCLACAAYVAPWSTARRAVHSQQDFGLYWKARLWLSLLGSAWLVRCQS